MGFLEGFGGGIELKGAGRCSPPSMDRQAEQTALRSLAAAPAGGQVVASVGDAGSVASAVQRAVDGARATYASSGASTAVVLRRRAGVGDHVELSRLDRRCVCIINEGVARSATLTLNSSVVGAGMPALAWRQRGPRHSTRRDRARAKLRAVYVDSGRLRHSLLAEAAAASEYLRSRGAARLRKQNVARALAGVDSGVAEAVDALCAAVAAAGRGRRGARGGRASASGRGSGSAKPRRRLSACTVHNAPLACFRGRARPGWARARR